MFKKKYVIKHKVSSVLRSIKLASVRMWCFFIIFITFFKWNWIKKLLLVLVSLSTIGLIYLLVRNFVEISRFFEKDNSQGELFKVCLTALAGIGALVALYYSARRVRAVEKGNVDTRFSNAVGHLGNENHAVVLGGIHALHQIAVKHKSYTQVVHSLFCSFIRENSTKLYEKIDFEKEPRKRSVIIQTLIDYLFNKDGIYKHFEFDLSHCTLINCEFKLVDIKNVNFSYSIMKNCFFSSGKKNLNKNGDLLTSKLTKCRFYGSELSGCHLPHLFDCVFEKVSFTDCMFYGVTRGHFWDSNMIKCEFMNFIDKCHFSNTNLTECRIRNHKEWNYHDNGLYDCKLTKCGFNFFITPSYIEFYRCELTECGFPEIAKEYIIDSKNKNVLNNCRFDESYH